MKRIFASLLLFALLPACASALLITDLNPYMLPYHVRSTLSLQLTPLAAHDYYLVRYVPIEGTDHLYAKQLHRFTDGKPVFELALGEEKASGYAPVLYGGEHLGVLRDVSRMEDQYIWKKDYTLFDVTEDGLINPRAFPDDPYQLMRLDTGFAGGCEVSPGQSKIVLYDDEANALLHTYFPYEDVRIQSFTRSDDALYLMAWRNASGGEGLMLLCIKDGQLAWASPYASRDDRFNALHAFSQGGVLMTGSLREDYMRYRVLCIGADGEQRWDKILSAPKAITHPKLTVVNKDGTVTLYGSCIAKSRNLFTVFAMRLDADGHVLSLDARDTFLGIAFPNDTEPDFYLAENGEVLVLLTMVEESADTQALVPFDAFPEANDPGIRLQ